MPATMGSNQPDQTLDTMEEFLSSLSEAEQVDFYKTLGVCKKANSLEEYLHTKRKLGDRFKTDLDLATHTQGLTKMGAHYIKGRIKAYNEKGLGDLADRLAKALWHNLEECQGLEIIDAEN